MSLIRRLLSRLRRDPGFGVLFVVTLALGVGANAALLAALHGYLLHPLPYRQGARLAVVNWRVPKGSPQAYPASVPIYRFLSGQHTLFAKTGLARTAQATVALGAAPRTVKAEEITASLFTTLGVKPYLGHFFAADADRPNGPAVAVVSFRFWQDALHGERDVVGRTITIDATPHRIVAVMGRRAYYPARDVAIYLPLKIGPRDYQPSQTTQGFATLIARLAPGVSQASLAGHLAPLSATFMQGLSSGLRGLLEKLDFQFANQPLRTFLYGNTAQRLGLIEIGALVLLALAIVNLVNLTLVRTLRRRQEIALRYALGAGRRDLLALALSETVPLAVASWGAAVALAYGGTAVLRAYGIGASATAFRIGVDPSVIALGLGIALLGAIVAAVPMVAAPRQRLLAGLTEGVHGSASHGANHLQRALSATQVAFAVALLVNAALLGFALSRLARVSPGFRPDHLVVAELTLQGPRFAHRNAALQFVETLLARARGLPGVADAAVADGSFGFPFTGNAGSSGFSPGSGGAVSGAAARKLQTAYTLFATGDLPGTLGLSLLRGTGVGPDHPLGAHEVLIDRTLARRFFGTTRVVGRTVIRGANGRHLVIRAVTARLLWGPPAVTDDLGTVILPYAAGAGGEPYLLVRASAPPPVIAHELRGLLARLAPKQSFTRIVPMRTLMHEALAPLSAPASLYGIFGLIALVLAAVGVYGVIAYRVRLRLREFAMRRALGATPAQIIMLGLVEGAWIAGIGIACGAIAGGLLHAFAGSAAVSAGILTLAFAATIAVMAAVVALAALVPAARAGRANLLSVLRPE